MEQDLKILKTVISVGLCMHTHGYIYTSLLWKIVVQERASYMINSVCIHKSVQDPHPFYMRIVIALLTTRKKCKFYYAIKIVLRFLSLLKALN